MNSLIKVLLLSTLLASSAPAATFIFTDFGSNYATGFGDSSSNIASGLTYGIVVDTSNNGFATSNWSAGFTYTAGNTTGIALVNSLGVMTDDVLFLHTAQTANLFADNDGALAGAGLATTISTLTYGIAAGYNGATGTAPTVGGGQNFAIIWFDRGIALGTTSISGQNFGLATSGTNGTPLFTTPGANGDTVDYSAAFLGADPTRTATLELIPEPSSLLLSALGVFALLRRRR
jgi:hypothetical protein